MANNILEYFQKMSRECKNPIHRAYYQSQLINNKGKNGYHKTKRVYSKKLDMYFNSCNEACEYVGKSNSYVYDCIKPNKRNPYGFIFL